MNQATGHTTVEESERFERFRNAWQTWGLSENTMIAYASDWACFSAWYHQSNGQQFDLKQLRPEDVADYCSYEQRHGRAARTVNRRITSLTRYVTWAEESGEIVGNIADQVWAVGCIQGNRPAPRILDRSETRRLMKEVELRADPLDKAVVYVLLCMGLRGSEIVGLTISDVDLSPQGGTLHVRALRSKLRGERHVPIPVEVMRPLQAYLNERAPTGFKALFIGKRGPIGADAVSRIVAKYAKLARVEGVSLYTLRHGYAHACRSGRSVI